MDKQLWVTNYDPDERYPEGKYPNRSKTDLNHAVKAARKAFESGPWATMSPSDRGRLLYKAAQKMWENSDFLAEVESKDNGLPINETKHIALPSTIDVLEFCPFQSELPFIFPLMLRK